MAAAARKSSHSSTAAPARELDQPADRIASGTMRSADIGASMTPAHAAPAPHASGLVAARTRASGHDADVPVVLRLPDLNAAPPTAPSAIKPPEVQTALSVYVLTAMLGLVWGFVAIDQWKAHKSKHANESAKHKTPVWNVQARDTNAPERDISTANRESKPQSRAAPAAADPAVANRAAADPAATDRAATAPASDHSAGAGDSSSTPAGGPLENGSPTTSTAPGAGSERSDYRTAGRTPPAVDPASSRSGEPVGAAQFEGTIERSALGPTYDRAQ